MLGHSTGGAIAVRYMARHNNHGVAKLVLAATAAPSLIKRPDFPYGLEKGDVLALIRQTSTDRPKMLEGFGEMLFYQHITEAFSDWFFQLGLEAANWSTIEVANTWLRETLFADLSRISAPTLILQGVHDMIVRFPLAEALHKGILNSKLISFDNSGHGLFYDEKDKFNNEVFQFVK